MKAAVRYVRANAEALGVDPGRVVVSGGSAGATNAVRAASPLMVAPLAAPR